MTEAGRAPSGPNGSRSRCRADASSQGVAELREFVQESNELVDEWRKNVDESNEFVASPSLISGEKPPRQEVRRPRPRTRPDDPARIGWKPTPHGYKPRAAPPWPRGRVFAILRGLLEDRPTDLYTEEAP